MLSGANNLRRAAETILGMGPHTLVIKRGEYGAILFREDGHFMVPGYLLQEVFDPTGAGDCFNAGFIAGLAHGLSDLQAARVGAAAAAACIRSLGGAVGIPKYKKLEKAIDF